MKNKTLAFPLLAITVIILVTLACGSSSTGVKVGTTSPSTSAPVQVTTYKIGDVIQVGDQTIVLNSAEFQGDTLHANFTIENKGSSDLNVSSLISFTAKDSEGSKLDQEIMDCSPGLDGKVLPGDKLKGNICWSGATTATVKIYYEAALFSSGAVVWEVNK
jgi:hypothetical protein